MTAIDTEMTGGSLPISRIPATHVADEYQTMPVRPMTGMPGSEPTRTSFSTLKRKRGTPGGSECRDAFANTTDVDLKRVHFDNNVNMHRSPNHFHQGTQRAADDEAFDTAQDPRVLYVAEPEQSPPHEVDDRGRPLLRSITSTPPERSSRPTSLISTADSEGYDPELDFDPPSPTASEEDEITTTFPAAVVESIELTASQAGLRVSPSSRHRGISPATLAMPPPPPPPYSPPLSKTRGTDPASAHNTDTDTIRGSRSSPPSRTIGTAPPLSNPHIRRAIHHLRTELNLTWAQTAEAISSYLSLPTTRIPSTTTASPSTPPIIPTTPIPPLTTAQLFSAHTLLKSQPGNAHLLAPGIRRAAAAGARAASTNNENGNNNNDTTSGAGPDSARFEASFRTDGDEKPPSSARRYVDWAEHGAGSGGEYVVRFLGMMEDRDGVDGGWDEALAKAVDGCGRGFWGVVAGRLEEVSGVSRSADECRARWGVRGVVLGE